jgi:type II secretory ATPase GspE/PulE/Tfp pilus assembly ATPase PilB-like protein
MLEVLKKENIVSSDATWETIPFYKPVPSEESESGYKGRLGIHEVLKMSSSIKELVLKGAPTDAIEKQAKEEGMMTMLEDGIFLAVQGRTSTEEVLRVVSE